MSRIALPVLALLLVCTHVTAMPSRYASHVTPSVAAYVVPQDLARVRHLDKAQDLTPERRAKLAALGFVVIPDRVEQMFFLYEDYGQDWEKGPIPNFITVDSVLQAYHIFFGSSLRMVEEAHLHGLLTALTQLCTGVAARQVTEAPPGLLREAASRNLAYFLVARNLLTGQAPAIQADLPGKDRIIELARQELALIAAHAGRSESPIMERTVHYDQFIPRGHYTRSEKLEKFFLTMMWYGTLAFELEDPPGDPGLLRRHTLQALLLTRTLADNEWGQSLWDRIYEPTRFFVGGADDLTWEDYLPIARDVFGRGLPMDGLADLGKLDAFMQAARRQLPAPRIAPAFLQADAGGALDTTTDAEPQGRQFRFMGQRFIPDSYALQQLVYPLVGAGLQGIPRYWPMGLDVMAMLGSDRARHLLVELYHQDQYENYLGQLDKVVSEFNELPEEEWWQNLYWGWLNSLRPLLEQRGAGYPGFMRTATWLDKQLMTAQASWAQLRHDTILYGKPSGAELGGPDPVQVEGYVEPYPEVYGRLAYLAHLSREGLESRGLLPERLAESYDAFENLLLFLKDCAEKQLTNRRLTRDEYDRIQWFGGEIERLTLDVVQTEDHPLGYWHEITNEADRNMATIADVHTSSDQCLQVGVGYANRIYVVVPHPAGGLQLAKGGVMSYYEFQWPVSDRLTDEKWIEMLKSGRHAAMPPWTGSFMAP